MGWTKHVGGSEGGGNVDASGRDLNDLSVVVLSHNRFSELSVFVPRLLRSARDTGFQLIVVDNRSTDGSREFLLAQDWRDDAQLLLSDQNLGVAAGRNLGWHSATRRYILNLDDDTRPDVEAMRALVQYMRHNKGTGLAFPRIVEPVSGDNQTPFGESVCEPSNFHGACHIVRRQTFLDTGPLDERCMYGGEELEYSIRMRTHGWRLEFIPSILVYHHSLPRTGEVASWRRLQWVHNYVRILFMYFPLGRATKMACRVTVKDLLFGCRNHGLAFAPRAIQQAILGAREGRGSFTPMPESLLAFYSSATLVPDFGNVPVSRKLRNRFRETRAESSRNKRKRTQGLLPDARWRHLAGGPIYLLPPNVSEEREG